MMHSCLRTQGDALALWEQGRGPSEREAFHIVYDT